MKKINEYQSAEDILSLEPDCWDRYDTPQGTLFLNTDNMPERGDLYQDLMHGRLDDELLFDEQDFKISPESQEPYQSYRNIHGFKLGHLWIKATPGGKNSFTAEIYHLNKSKREKKLLFRFGNERYSEFNFHHLFPFVLSRHMTNKKEDSNPHQLILNGLAQRVRPFILEMACGREVDHVNFQMVLSDFFAFRAQLNDHTTQTSSSTSHLDLIDFKKNPELKPNSPESLAAKIAYSYYANSGIDSGKINLIIQEYLQQTNQLMSSLDQIWINNLVKVTVDRGRYPLTMLLSESDLETCIKHVSSENSASVKTASSIPNPDHAIQIEIALYETLFKASFALFEASLTLKENTSLIKASESILKTTMTLLLSTSNENKIRKLNELNQLLRSLSSEKIKDYSEQTKKLIATIQTNFDLFVTQIDNSENETRTIENFTHRDTVMLNDWANPDSFPTGKRIKTMNKIVQQNFQKIIIGLISESSNIDTLMAGLGERIGRQYTRVDSTINKEIEKVVESLIERVSQEGTELTQEKFYVDTYGEFIDTQVKKLIIDTLFLPQLEPFTKQIKNCIIRTRFKILGIRLEEAFEEEHEKRLLETIVLNVVLKPFQTHYTSINQIQQPIESDEFREWVSVNEYSHTIYIEWLDLLLPLKWACKFSWPPIRLSQRCSTLKITPNNELLINDFLVENHATQYNLYFDREYMLFLWPDLEYLSESKTIAATQSEASETAAATQSEASESAAATQSEASETVTATQKENNYHTRNNSSEIHYLHYFGIFQTPLVSPTFEKPSETFQVKKENEVDDTDAPEEDLGGSCNIQ